jgi:hypothetical protein
MAVVNHIHGSSDHLSEVLHAAIAADAGVSFLYEKPDGTITKHNAVYPKQLFHHGQHTLVRAYCHFTRDSRIFRVDRMRAVRIRRRLPHLPWWYEVAGAIGAIALLIAVVIFLLFYSPKYRWRQLRHQLLGSATTPNASHHIGSRDHALSDTSRQS